MKSPWEEAPSPIPAEQEEVAGTPDWEVRTARGFNWNVSSMGPTEQPRSTAEWEAAGQYWRLAQPQDQQAKLLSQGSEDICAELRGSSHV